MCIRDSGCRRELLLQTTPFPLRQRPAAKPPPRSACPARALLRHLRPERGRYSRAWSGSEAPRRRNCTFSVPQQPALLFCAGVRLGAHRAAEVLRRARDDASSDEPSSVRHQTSRASLHTSSESHSVECRFMGALCVDLATTPGSVPDHDPLRLSCDSGKSTKGIREPQAMWLDSLAGWSSAQRARSP